MRVIGANPVVAKRSCISDLWAISLMATLLAPAIWLCPSYTPPTFMAPSPTVKIVQSSDGNPIYAEAIGDPSKPSMVLVHGFNLSAAALDRLFFDKRMLEDLYMVRYVVQS